MLGATLPAEHGAQGLSGRVIPDRPLFRFLRETCEQGWGGVGWGKKTTFHLKCGSTCSLLREDWRPGVGGGGWLRVRLQEEGFKND